METANEKLYWIWLSLIFPYGSDKPNQILMDYSTPEDFYNSSKEQMFKHNYLTQKDVQLIKMVSLDRAKLVIDDCAKIEVNIVTFHDELYPERLKLIYGPPVVLYVQGDISGIDDEVLITVVGTRKATKYTAVATEYLCCKLAEAGAIIVSGCAVGIDTTAHKGALRAGGRTISVLACGHDVNYPTESHDLKIEILKRGALISELPPKTTVTPRIFPIRNRIMAGLALGVFVTHAPERSGSLITVEHGIEQGKDIFCLPPRNIFDTQYSGVVKYIRDGAKPVFSEKDILIEYYSTHSHKLRVDKIIGEYINQKNKEAHKEKIKKDCGDEIATIIEPPPNVENIKDLHKEIIAEFNEEQLKIYNTLTLTPQFIDDISIGSGSKVGDVLAVLTELEIAGVAGSFSGRRYALIK